MSRDTYTTIVVSCDFPGACAMEYEGGPGEGLFDVQHAARAAGWASTWKGDYCPAHAKEGVPNV